MHNFLGSDGTGAVSKKKRIRTRYVELVVCIRWDMQVI
jgi:hypothetical protein